MLSQILDTLCTRKNPKEEKKSMIKVIFSESTTTETLKPSFSKYQLEEKNKLNSTKTNSKFISLQSHLFVNNDNESISNSPCSQKKSLISLKLPNEEIIKQKIKMFGNFGTKKKRINENLLFQNFQNKVDDIIIQCLKEKTISESDDSEKFVIEN